MCKNSDTNIQPYEVELVDGMLCFNSISVCDTAPYPWCNGAEGCDNCEYQEED